MVYPRRRRHCERGWLCRRKDMIFFYCIAKSQDKGRRNARGLGFHFQRNHPGLLSWAEWEQEKETGSMPWHAICN